MTSDIYFKNAVDLVIFTLVNQENLPAMYWESGLVSPASAPNSASDNPQRKGLGLFVVTVPVDADRYPSAVNKRQLPGGFMGEHETLRQAAQRVANEKLGISLKTRLRQLETFDQPNRDPNGRVLSFPFWCMVNWEEISFYLGGKERIGLELVNDVQILQDFTAAGNNLDFFDGVSRFGNRTMPSFSRGQAHTKTLTDDMGGRILALDHDEMVFYAWRQLRHAFTGKLDPFQFLGINPLGAEFRLSDLREFNDVCLGSFADRETFRRRMNIATDSWVKATGKVDSSATGRSKPGKPALLYSPQVIIDDEEY